jgi:hypothetical protein
MRGLCSLTIIWLCLLPLCDTTNTSYISSAFWQHLTSSLESVVTIWIVLAGEILSWLYGTCLDDNDRLVLHCARLQTPSLILWRTAVSPSSLWIWITEHSLVTWCYNVFRWMDCDRILITFFNQLWWHPRVLEKRDWNSVPWSNTSHFTALRITVLVLHTNWRGWIGWKHAYTAICHTLIHNNILLWWNSDCYKRGKYTSIELVLGNS